MHEEIQEVSGEESQLSQSLQAESRQLEISKIQYQPLI
jgi:hypothetical protein